MPLLRPGHSFPAPVTSDSLAGTGIKVAVLSVDNEPATAELTAGHGLTFPSGLGLLVGKGDRNGN